MVVLELVSVLVLAVMELELVSLVEELDRRSESSRQACLASES